MRCVDYEKKKVHWLIKVLSSFITIFLFVIFAATLSREFGETDALNLLKYAILLTFVIFFVLVTRSQSGSITAAAGFLFFLFFGFLYTIFFAIDLVALLNVAGYAMLLVIYSVFSSRTGHTLAEYFYKNLALVSVCFVILNLLYIGNPDAYSYGKNQFSGFIANPNAFSGFSGMFFLISLWVVFDKNANMTLRIASALSAALLILMLALCFSRGAILSLILSILFLGVPLRYKIIFGICFGVVGFVMLVSLAVPEDMTLNRSLSEETGRTDLFGEYINKIAEYGLVVGTGFSLEGDRIKSELSYLDILLSSGVGFIGFAYFWFLSLRDAVFARKEHLGKIASSIVVFVTSLSLVEGYLANVASFVTVTAYVSAGVCFYESRSLKKRNYANAAR